MCIGVLGHLVLVVLLDHCNGSLALADCGTNDLKIVELIELPDERQLQDDDNPVCNQIDYQGV